MRLARPHVHPASIVGRMRTDPGPLLLMAVVVGLTTALTSAVTPLEARTADRALSEAVSAAGERADVVASLPPADPDLGPRTRDPQAVTELRAAMTGAHYQLPRRVVDVLRAPTATVTTSPLQLLDDGPGRYLTLVHLDGPSGPPPVRYVAGGAPPASAGGDHAQIELPDTAPPWPVHVAVSRAAATALGLQPGDRLPAQDQLGRRVDVRVSGIFVPRSPDAAAWRTAAQLLRPAHGSSSHGRASAAALVSSSALPDLRLAVPSSDVSVRLTFSPRVDAVHETDARALVRALVALKASGGPTTGSASWDTGLDQVVEEGLARVAAARGQAQVLVIAVLVCTFLVLWQAADLLVRRRFLAVVLTRERGGTLVAIALELFTEALACALTGTVVGLLGTWLAVGRVGWGWWVSLPILAASVAAGTSAVLASGATDPRRTPANRSARRAVARRVLLARCLFVATVGGAAGLSFVALHERGVLGTGGATGEPLAASAPTWWTIAGALLVVAALPPLARLLLDIARRTSGSVAFLAAARVRESAARALPVLVVTVAVAQLTFALGLNGTEERGQEAGALLRVGGDARAVPSSGRSALEVARTVTAAPGVRAAVAGRVEEADALSRQGAERVLLVVVDAASYQRLLVRSPLPDAPALSRLVGGTPGGVPALLLGGPPGAADGLTVSVGGGRRLSLTVVGEAPRVQGAAAVVVVDAAAYGRAGGIVTPNTVWAVGPGAAAAVRTAVGSRGAVLLYRDVLAQVRSAALPSGLVHLTVASSALLLLLSGLALALAAAGDAAPRAVALGRLRALGVADRHLRGVLVGELLAPALVGVLAGLLLGWSAVRATAGRLSLERITGEVTPPRVGVPPWALAGDAVLVLTVLVLAQVEWSRVRHVVLAQLLRGGPPR